MARLEENLLLKYKKMIDLVNIDNISKNTIFKDNVNITLSLNITGNATFIDNSTLLSNLNVNQISTNNTTINSQLNINSGILYDNSLVKLNTSIYGKGNVNNINVNKETLCYKHITFNSQLNVNNESYFRNNIIVNYISNNSLLLKGNTINIGNSQSQININGTINNIISINLKIADKYVNLNYNKTTNSGFDIGNLSGIDILTNNSNSSYIRTNIDATRYEIKAPNNITSSYILTTDLNNNLNISGICRIQNDLNGKSNLNVSGNSILNSVSILSSLVYYNNLNLPNTLNIQGNLNILNDSTINKLNINNKLLLNNITFNDTITINSILNISNFSIFQNNVSALDSVQISGNTIINGNLINNNISNILGDVNINNTVSGITFVINNNLLIFGDTSSKSSLNINKALLNNVSIKSNLTVCGNYISNNDMIISSQSNNIVSVYGQFINNLPEYLDNASAIQGGVPIWGFYRTGSIVKICIN